MQTELAITFFLTGIATAILGAMVPKPLAKQAFIAASVVSWVALVGILLSTGHEPHFAIP